MHNKIKGINVLIEAIPFINKDIKLNLAGYFPKLKPLNKGKELVIKIRPHLVHISPNAQKKDSNCLIKVFTFKNERHAKRDKYSQWNIFRLIK